MSSKDKSTDGVILPGSTIGMLGSGQLGRMTAMAAKHMGYRVHVFSPTKDSPAGQVADLEIHAQYTDTAAVEEFAKQVDVVTLEFENLPVQALEAVNRHSCVHPGVKTLSTTQNRSLEKSFLNEQNIPTCKFEIVRSMEELTAAAESILPAVLKTTRDGYDGKGQVVIRDRSEVEAAWETLQTDEAILEDRNQILDVSFSPSNLSAELNAKAIEIASQIMEALGTVGVLCVEFFCCQGEVLVNEIAPRPHNSCLAINGMVVNQIGPKSCRCLM